MRILIRAKHPRLLGKGDFFRNDHETGENKNRPIWAEIAPPDISHHTLRGNIGEENGHIWKYGEKNYGAANDSEIFGTIIFSTGIKGRVKTAILYRKKG